MITVKNYNLSKYYDVVKNPPTLFEAGIDYNMYSKLKLYTNKC